jgi:hypothetical protein
MGPEWCHQVCECVVAIYLLRYVYAHGIIFPQRDSLMDSRRVEHLAMFSVPE